MQNEIKGKILSDLYDTPTEALKVRRTQIAERNRNYYMEPYLMLMGQLPDDLIAKERKFVVKIRYNVDAIDKTKSLKEEWTYISDKPLPNPVNGSGGYYSTNPVSQPLDCRLIKDAATLSEDILSFNSEYSDLNEYITDTFAKWSGTVQLRKIWPASLHKYLPAEPPKKPKALSIPKIKKETPEMVEAPATLNTRLTTNLLEGS